VTAFADASVEDIRDAVNRIIDEYFACYGALLNLAVFPLENTRKVHLEPVRVIFADLEHARCPINVGFINALRRHARTEWRDSAPLPT
jgi:hypothetical protein